MSAVYRCETPCFSFTFFKGHSCQLQCFIYNCCCTGSTVDYRDGFVGCIRALLLNGQLMDLRSYANRGIYGMAWISSIIRTPGVIIYANKWLFIEYVYYASGSHTSFGVWMFWCALCCGLWLKIQALEERSPILITVYTRTCQFVLRAGHCLCLSEFIPQWRTKWCF